MMMRLFLRYIVLSIIVWAWCPVAIRTQTPCGRPHCPKKRDSQRRQRHRVNGNAGKVTPTVETEAKLTVRTEPGSEVCVAGQECETTNETGVLVINAKPGKHVVLTATKPGYDPETRTISLEPAEIRSLSFELRPQDGKLSVIPNVSGSDIQVSEVGAYQDKVSDLQVSPGRYSIRVSKHCYQSALREVVVKPGERRQVDVILNLQSVDDLLAVADSNWQVRNYDSAMTAVKCVLAAVPTHPHANLMMGRNLYLAENYSASSGYLMLALKGGEPITLPVAYYHDSFHQGSITLRKQSLEFHSANEGNLDFSIPASRIYSVAVVPRKGYCLRIVVGVPTGPKEVRRDLDFHPPRGTSKNSICPTCKAELEVLQSLVQQIRNY